MKTYIISILLSLYIATPLYAQVVELEWVKHIGGSMKDEGQIIDIDLNNNVYTSGYYSNTVDFDPGPGIHNLTSFGRATFVQKMNANGEFLWAKKTIEHSSSYRDMKVDHLGNVYTTGSFASTLDFDPDTSVFNLVSNGSFDGFIHKLDSNGNFCWVKQIGGEGSDAVQGLIIDNNGSIFVLGKFVDTVDFDPGLGVYNLVNESGLIPALFIQKLDSNGDFIWAKKIEKSGYYSKIALDVNGNVYVSGQFRGTVDFDPGLGVHNMISAEQSDIFVLKLNPNGEFIWVKQFESIGFISNAYAYGIAVDNDGGVYTIGSFKDSIDFDPSALESMAYSNGHFDSYIHKLDSNGEFLWVNHIGGRSMDQGLNLALDNSGNINVIGHFGDTVDFNIGTGVSNLISEYGSDTFILQLNSNGGFNWVQHIKSSTYVTGIGIDVDADGYIYITGEFEETTDFDPTIDTFNLYAVGERDIFIQKLFQCTSLTPSLITLPPVSGICSIDTLMVPTASNTCGNIITGIPSTIFPITDSSITEIIWTFIADNGDTIMQNQPINWSSVDVSITSNNQTITANNSNAIYQWLDCSNGYQPLFGQNNKSFVISSNGNYAVEITEEGCIDTSECMVINTIDIAELEQLNSIRLFQDIETGSINIDFGRLENKSIRVINQLGKIVYQKDGISASTFNIGSKISQGIYVVEVYSDKVRKQFKIIK